MTDQEYIDISTKHYKALKENEKRAWEEACVRIISEMLNDQNKSKYKCTSINI